jgi:hypothetical protein
MRYDGPADCILPDGNVLPVRVSLRAEPGLLDGLTGTATGAGLAFLNLTNVRLRLPEGRERMFLVKDARFGRGTEGSLELVSNGDWL